jgi:hypothetical protein
MIRVILVAPDGTHVEARTDAGYAPDIADDLTSRCRELMADVQRDLAHLATDTGAS